MGNQANDAQLKCELDLHTRDIASRIRVANTGKNWRQFGRNPEVYPGLHVCATLLLW